MTGKANLVSELLLKHCKQKGYQINPNESKDKIRFEISNGLERVIVDIYHTGAFVPGGSTKYKLRKEFDELKKVIDNNPEVMLNEIRRKKSISVKYDVLEKVRGEKILEALKLDEIVIEFESDPPSTQVYHGKIEMAECNTIITQYTNGTLLIQGKENDLFDRVCSIVEKILLPSEKDVALRFLSTDEKTMEDFMTIYSPKILEKAEENIKRILGSAFGFLEEYDRKYLIASECLVLANLNLPEFSPIVMPAAKAFEGFTKKLLVKIGLLPTGHFNVKGASFSILSDRNHPNRKSIIAKEKYAGSFLDSLANTLDMARNFMMHSDDSQVTKVNSHEEAIAKQSEICKSIVDLYEYFNQSEFGGLI